jgi:hypothetical protein
VCRDELSRELSQRLFSHGVGLIQALEESNLRRLQSSFIYHGLDTPSEVGGLIIIVESRYNIA